MLVLDLGTTRWLKYQHRLYWGEETYRGDLQQMLEPTSLTDWG
jgi:hypothetical protein